MKLYFIAAMLIFANSVASDTSVYSPSSKMKSFNKNDFSTSSDYFMTLIVGPAVLLGFGVILTFIFLCWSVCRSCKCLQCCCDCQQPTTGKIKFYLILLIALTAGCIAMVPKQPAVRLWLRTLQCVSNLFSSPTFMLGYCWLRRRCKAIEGSQRRSCIGGYLEQLGDDIKR